MALHHSDHKGVHQVQNPTLGTKCFVLDEKACMVETCTITIYCAT